MRRPRAGPVQSMGEASKIAVWRPTIVAEPILPTGSGGQSSGDDHSGPDRERHVSISVDCSEEPEGIGNECDNFAD
jgi:hypothetical protein